MDDDVVEVRHHNFDLRRLEFNPTIDPFHIDKYAEAYTRLIGECITLLESFTDLKGEMASLRGEARFNRDEVNRLGVQITELEQARAQYNPIEFEYQLDLLQGQHDESFHEYDIISNCRKNFYRKSAKIFDGLCGKLRECYKVTRIKKNRDEIKTYFEQLKVKAAEIKHVIPPLPADIEQIEDDIGEHQSEQEPVQTQVVHIKRSSSNEYCYVSEEADVKVIHVIERDSNADIFVRCKSKTGEEERTCIIPLHKDVLVKNIPYVAALYNPNSNWKESSTSTANATEIMHTIGESYSAEVLTHYFQSIYESKFSLPTSFDETVESFRLADYLGDTKLSGVLQSQIEAFLSLSNLKEVWRLNSATLREACVAKLRDVCSYVYPIYRESSITALGNRIKRVVSSFYGRDECLALVPDFFNATVEVVGYAPHFRCLRELFVEVEGEPALPLDDLADMLLKLDFDRAKCHALVEVHVQKMSLDELEMPKDSLVDKHALQQAIIERYIKDGKCIDPKILQHLYKAGTPEKKVSAKNRCKRLILDGDAQIAHAAHSKSKRSKSSVNKSTNNGDGQGPSTQ